MPSPAHRVAVVALVVAMAVALVLAPFPFTQIAILGGFAAGWYAAYVWYSDRRRGDFRD